MCHKVALKELPAVLTLRRVISKAVAQFFCGKSPTMFRRAFFLFENQFFCGTGTEIIVFIDHLQKFLFFIIFARAA